tara:strand:+ start:341 stop:712 length:372 start_codon:yes stop_codon:yes gene_type:complete
MKRFFYFRSIAVAADDDSENDSVLVAVEDITGMEATSATGLNIFFKSVNNLSAGGQQGGVVIQDTISLTVVTQTQKSIMKAIVEAMNNGPHEDGITVIADDVTESYIVPEITACGQIITAAIQ